MNNNHSVMFPLLQDGYNTGLYNKAMIEESVGLGWITQDEANEILGINPKPASETNSVANSSVNSAANSAANSANSEVNSLANSQEKSNDSNINSSVASANSAATSLAH